MKARWYASLLVLWAAAGCVPMSLIPKEADVPPPPATAPQRLRVCPVTPDQVTETNAVQKADALRQELDREADVMAEQPQNH